MLTSVALSLRRISDSGHSLPIVNIFRKDPQLETGTVRLLALVNYQETQTEFSLLVANY